MILKKFKFNSPHSKQELLECITKNTGNHNKAYIGTITNDGFDIKKNQKKGQLMNPHIIGKISDEGNNTTLNISLSFGKFVTFTIIYVIIISILSLFLVVYFLVNLFNGVTSNVPFSVLILLPLSALIMLNISNVVNASKKQLLDILNIKKYNSQL